METSISFIKLELYFFDFLAVFVAPNFKAITKNWLKYGVELFENIFWAKLSKLRRVLENFENNFTCLKSKIVLDL